MDIDINLTNIFNPEFFIEKNLRFENEYQAVYALNKLKKIGFKRVINGQQGSYFYMDKDYNLWVGRTKMENKPTIFFNKIFLKSFEDWLKEINKI